MANGTLVIFSRKSIATPLNPGDASIIPGDCKIKCDIPEYADEARDWEDPLILTLSPEGYHVCPVKCMTFVGSDRVWCGCGNNISVVDTVNVKAINSIPVLVKRNHFVTELVSNGVCVWGIGRQLSCVIEWVASTYQLVRIFDCSRVDPTGDFLIGSPKSVPELITGESKEDIGQSPHPSPPVKEDISDDSSSPLARSTSPIPGASAFVVQNDPSHPSRSSGPTYNTRFGTKISDRPKRARRHNMKELARPTAHQQSNFEEAKKLAGLHKLLRTQGATRTTSLLMVNDVLWVARGMGDILIIDCSGQDQHGQVMARLMSEDEMKYGNRSTHKIVLVAGEYVVSSQWLEPLEMPRTRAPTELGPADRHNTLSDHPAHHSAHQQITIWKAWDHARVLAYNQKVNNMIKFSGTE